MEKQEEEWQILFSGRKVLLSVNFILFILIPNLMHGSTLDMDKSGFLDFKEFLLAMDLVAARTVEEKLLWCFKLYDTDNSGVIDKSEMANIMESVYNMLDAVKARPDDDPKERAGEIFSRIDVNNDGELNREEFLMGCQQDQDLMNLLNRQFNIISHGFGE